MFGEKATAMVERLQRATWLPPYDDTMREVLTEIDELHAKANDWLQRHTEETEDGGSRLALDGEEERSEFVAVFVLLVGAVERNKRCCMALTHQRLEKLQQLRWEIGKVIPAEQKQLCSQKEQEFAQEYNASLDRYMNDTGLDLTSDQKPPRGMFIDVLAMEDVGTIVTDSGMSMTLKKDTMHRVRRSEVEHLIRQGALEQRS